MAKQNYGFDVDGVLADFIRAFQCLIIDISGKNLFEPQDADNPPTWHWPQHRGYSNELMDFNTGPVWRHIKSSPDFWRELGEHDGASTLAMVIADLERKHDIYFVTNRQGDTAKQQTEEWLTEHIGLDAPTVLISEQKGMCAKALKLDAYIDDNLKNCLDVAERSPDTRCYLLTKAYNQSDLALPESIRRVNTLGQMLDYELLNL
jgi:5'(3')-deoxyribonucleotidase